MHKVNFTGHPAPGFDLAPLVGVNLPIEDTDALVRQITAVLADLPCDEALRAGASAEIALPGMSPATGVLLAEWHGRYGSFPTIRWAVRGEKGFEWPESARVDLQALRTEARTRR